MLMRRAGAIVFGVVMMGASAGLYAAPKPATTGEAQGVVAKHGKMVSFMVKNETAGPLSLKLGDEPMTLDPGKMTKVTLPLGARVTFAEASGEHAAGALLAEANGVTKGTTITVH